MNSFNKSIENITDEDIILYIVNNDESELRHAIDHYREEDAMFNLRVFNWEGILYGLHESETKQLVPSEQVWKNIENKLFSEKAPKSVWYHRWLPKITIPLIVATFTFVMVKNSALTELPKNSSMTASLMMQDDVIWDVKSDGRVVSFHNKGAIPNAPKVKCLVWALLNGETYVLGDVPDEGEGKIKNLFLPSHLQARKLKLIVQDFPMDSDKNEPDYSGPFISGELNEVI